MCGFLGIKSFEINNFNDLIFEARENIKLINHRGPDANADWVSEKKQTYFTFNRLSIIDTSNKGMQPMTSDCKKFVMMFNGEIYNYLEIKKELLNKSVKFNSKSDSEVLLKSFINFGIEKTLKKINGMFSIVLFNLSENKIYLIKDRIGKKPLYWALIDNVFYFSSQVKCIINFKNFNKKINFKTLNNYFVYGYNNGHYSIFEKVNQVKPGHYLTIDSKQNVVEKEYWSINENTFKNNFLPNKNQYLEKFDELLLDATKIRTRSDVPIGSFLSSGIDSSSIAVTLKKRLNLNPIFFTASFENSEFDEGDEAKQVSNLLDCKFKKLLIKPHDCINIIESIPEYFDEPFADYSAIPSMAISKMTSENVKVVLTGDGGDETFAGYNRYKAALLFQKYKKLFNSKVFNNLLNFLSKLNPKLIDNSQYLLPKSKRHQFLHDKLIKFKKMISSNENIEFYNNILFSWGDESDKILIQNEKKQYDESLYIENFDLGFIKSLLTQLQYLDLYNYLPNDILVKVDRSTMAYGLESRSPLLDYRLVEMGISLPDNLKIERGKTKLLLRKYLKHNLKGINFNRPKKGFSLPLHSWLRKEIKEWAENLIYDYNHDFIKKDIIIDKWKEHLTGKRNWHNQIWTYLMFVSWYNKWV